MVLVRLLFYDVLGSSCVGGRWKMEACGQVGGDSEAVVLEV